MAIKGTVKIFKVFGLEILRVEEYHCPENQQSQQAEKVGEFCVGKDTADCLKMFGAQLGKVCPTCPS